ncbi:MAG: M3 family oligoendopeptidase [Vulcanimicrobiaceae bacterium]
MTIKTAASFSEIQPERPDLPALQSAYADIAERFDRSATVAGRAALVREWDALRRKTETWNSLAQLHFEQDTRSAKYQAERRYHDEIAPELTALDVEMKTRLVKSSHRAELEREFGSHVFMTWTIDISAFDPKIQPDMIEEARLSSEYTSIIGSAAVDFHGETHNLAALDSFTKVADRETRHEAYAVRTSFYQNNGQELDRIFDDLVRTRHATARKLGFENFVPLGYKRMKRLDYNEQDVSRYREEVLQHIVPLAEAVVRERGSRLKLRTPMYWDESLHDSQGNPRPLGTHDWLLGQGAAAFHAMNPELGSFFDHMVSGKFLDLENRPGKNGGGFCTNFPSYGMPYIFANFNGTDHDVVVLMHEMGHAFQNYSSRHVALYDNLWPTYETAEVHSMSLEYLSFGEMERFFGDDAHRFREHHLAEALLFIPYGVAVDHFQHLVYEQPEATPDQRHAMWQRVEKLYMPWRQYGDLKHLSKGTLWQEKRHIYLAPFYYIDYTLAQCCALQFWSRSRTDFNGALHDYIALCARGGTQSFSTLIRSANIRSPFEAGALAEVASEARKSLGLSLAIS